MRIILSQNKEITTKLKPICDLDMDMIYLYTHARFYIYISITERCVE